MTMHTKWNRVKSPQQTTQTTLETSEQGKLKRKAPDDFIQDRDGNKSRPSLILDLPTELLTRILELVLVPEKGNRVPWRLKQMSWDPTAIPALAYTCRRFSQIAVPFNFRNIYFEYARVVPVTARPRRLAHVLRSNPSLGSYCRDFHMSICDDSHSREHDFEFAVQLLSFFPNLRSLSVHGGFGDYKHESTWNLLRTCLPRMCHLEKVSLSREAIEGLKVAEVIRELQVHVPGLKELEVHGFAKNSIPPLEGPKAVNLTSMNLSDYTDGPKALERLLSWPRALSKFTLAPFYNNPFYIDLQMVKDMLLKHRESLKEINIGYLSEVEGTRAKPPHWREFPALEALALSRWVVGPRRQSTSEPQPEALDWILTPWIKKFTLAFTIWDQHSEQLSDFSEVEEAWVRWLAEAAIKRKWSLQEIRIQFDPEWWHPEEHHEVEYPWDRMDSLNKEFQPKGIIITYSDPPVTRGYWAKTYVPKPA